MWPSCLAECTRSVHRPRAPISRFGGCSGRKLSRELAWAHICRMSQGSSTRKMDNRAIVCVAVLVGLAPFDRESPQESKNRTPSPWGQNRTRRHAQRRDLGRIRSPPLTPKASQVHRRDLRKIRSPHPPLRHHKASQSPPTPSRNTISDCPPNRGFNEGKPKALQKTRGGFHD